MAKITWNDRENSGDNSRISASIFNETKDSVNSTYDIIEAQLGTTSSTSTANLHISGTINVSGSIIPNVASGETTSSFDLGSETAAWKDIYVSEGSIKYVTGASTSSFSKTDVDNLKAGKSISTVEGKQLVNENDDTTYVRMSSTGRATHYAGGNVAADFKSNQVTLGATSGSSTGLSTAIPGGIVGGLALTGSQLVTNPTTTTSSLLSVYPPDDPVQWIGADFCGNIFINCEANILHTSNTLDLVGQGYSPQTQRSAVFGISNTLYGKNSLAVGSSNTISGSTSPGSYSSNVVLGSTNLILNQFWSFAQGDTNTLTHTVLGRGNVAFGAKNKAENTNYAWVSGFKNTASADYAYAEGSASIASGVLSRTMGQQVVASGRGAYVHGSGSLASELHGFIAASTDSTASATYASIISSKDVVAEGRWSSVVSSQYATASGNYSHIVASASPTASGEYSFVAAARSQGCRATGPGSVSIAGERAEADGTGSLAHGSSRINSGSHRSVGFNNSNLYSGSYSGFGANGGKVYGPYATSVNEGIASGSYTFAAGTATAISSQSFAIGLYNDLDNAASEKQLFVIGKGTSDTPRDAFTVYTDKVIIDLNNLPTADPEREGQLYRDLSGILMVSLG